jgi:hypothetical protein
MVCGVEVGGVQTSAARLLQQPLPRNARDREAKDPLGQHTSARVVNRRL